MQCSFLCVTPQGWPRWRVLVLDYLLDDAMCHALEFVHQALRVPMKRMGHHVVHLLTLALVRSSDGTDRCTLSRATSGENPFHLMPWLRVLSKEPMRSASSRALISSYFFLCSGGSSSYVMGLGGGS